MKLREIAIYPLIVAWGVLTTLLFFIHPEAAATLLKETAQKSGVLDV